MASRRVNQLLSQLGTPEKDEDYIEYMRKAAQLYFENEDQILEEAGLTLPQPSVGIVADSSTCAVLSEESDSDDDEEPLHFMTGASKSFFDDEDSSPMLFRNLSTPAVTHAESITGSIFKKAPKSQVRRAFSDLTEYSHISGRQREKITKQASFSVNTMKVLPMKKLKRAEKRVMSGICYLFGVWL